MKGKLRLKLNSLLIITVLLMSACFFVACNEDKPQNPYANDNSFEVIATDGEDTLEFAPKDFTPTYGVVFYVGALIAPESYTYLGQALATQGYLVVIPKIANTLDYNNYNPNISAFTKYPNVKFFVGGHDAGGGLAVRHAMDYAEYNYNVAGIILYAPIGFSKPKYENGQPVYDEENNPVFEHFTTAELSIPTLLIEVDDELQNAFKQTAKEHINSSVTTCHTLTNSISAHFSTAGASSLTDANAIALRESTVNYTLKFANDTVETIFKQSNN